MASIIVIGSGIAGLLAAIRASERHDVTLVTKGALGMSNTRYAQGGIAGVMFEEDSVESHVSDTLVAGAGLCDEQAVRILCTEGPERIRELIALGVEFDRENGELSHGLEAAHSFPRILHAGGDATGARIEEALVERVRQTAASILENTFLLDLVTDGSRVTGAELLSADGDRFSLEADVVVLATGGAGQIFEHTTNPAVTTGDGVAAALRAGAEITDAEFYQFHPTTLAADGNFLISEAVRGEGAVLINARGERFMTTIHDDVELAPRDVVARAIAVEMAAQNGIPVRLDATALGADFLEERFPTIDAAVRAAGFDWAREPIPVTPASHYWMGGVRTDLEGRTSLSGLFAIGEAARTGVHGANRLASNSLLEGAVFAARAVSAIGSDWTFDDDLESRMWPSDDVKAHGDEAADLPFTREALQKLMWENVGLMRDGDVLVAASAQFDAWDASLAPVTDNDVRGHEDRNLLLLARLIAHQALTRKESRGAHFRSDYPLTDAAMRRSFTVIAPVAVPLPLPELETA